MEDITDRTLKKRLTISLDYSLLAKLDKRNRSGDVERILREYFLTQNADKLYTYIKQRLIKDNLISDGSVSFDSIATGVYKPPVQDEELENKRRAYGEDGWLFRRHYTGELQANKPPSREWVDAGLVNY